MKKLLSALAKAFRGAATAISTVWTYCKDSGKWIGKTVSTTIGAIGDGGGADAGHAEQIAADNDNGTDALLKESQALVDSVEIPKARGGDGYDIIQRVCRDLCSGDEPSGRDLEYLTPLQKDWINLMSPEMRLIVGNESREAVVSHMRGGKVLRGVMRSDAESVNLWKDTLHREIEDSRPMWENSITMQEDDVPLLRHTA